MMDQVAQIIPSYAGDTSGACSALYELGGLTVIHDASRCIATYSAFDEPRWQTQNSLVFSSNLTETEAILGDDQRLIDDTIQAAKEYQPNFIALVGSPIPAVTAVDFPAIASEVQHATDIPSIGVNATGMKSYISGASLALAGLAEKVVRNSTGRNKIFSVNILGMTPLDFSINGTSRALVSVLQEHGIQVQSSWAMDSNFEAIQAAGKAKVNLVVSFSGLRAAQVLQRRFDIPYVIGVPYGDQMMEKIAVALRLAVEHHQNQTVFEANDEPDPKLVLIGESITSQSFAQAIYESTGVKATVLCPVESAPDLLGKNGSEARDEVVLKPYLQRAEIIIADPLYQPICPKTARFIPMPQESFSGRMYRQEIPDLITDFSTFRKKFGI